MVSSKGQTVKEYLEGLEPDRKKAISAVRTAIRKKLPKGFKEGMQYGMISYFVPLTRYPDTYNGQALTLASLGSQKSHMAVYLMCVYSDPKLRKKFESAYRASGKKMDMGKSCLRFKKLDDLPVEVVADAVGSVSVEGLIAQYEASRPKTKKRPKK